MPKTTTTTTVEFEHKDITDLIHNQAKESAKRNGTAGTLSLFFVGEDGKETPLAGKIKAVVSYSAGH